MNKPSLFRSNHLYLFGLILLVSSLPLSLFLTSLSQFILLCAFFVEGNFREKIHRFLHNKPAMILVGIWLIHLIGLIYTSDLSEGLKDARIKLPLLIFPVIIAGSDPLSEKQFRWVMTFFIGAVFTGTMVSMAVLTGIIHRPVQDIRDIFIFHISHIRFALFTCIALCTLFYYLFSGGTRLPVYGKILLGMLVLWFIVFLVIMESVTGLSILVFTGALLLLYESFKKGRTLFRVVFFILAVAIPLAVVYTMSNYLSELKVRHDVAINRSDTTALGNQYSFDVTDQERENGYLVWYYLSENELRSAWNSRSVFYYDSLDMRGQHLKYTLIRFLTSKGFRKDAEGVIKLSAEEVHAVERGVANVNYQDLTSMKARLMQIVWEWDHFIKGGDPSGHSVTQRLEFWKTATGIISEHPWIGVGTGDMPEAYRLQYEKNKSKLSHEWRLRAHNQYLAIAVAFGFAGLAYFIFALLFPLLYNQKFRDYFYCTFWIIACLSMLTEDTLETQPGATFFAFFSAFFLFGRGEALKTKN